MAADLHNKGFSFQDQIKSEDPKLQGWRQKVRSVQMMDVLGRQTDCRLDPDKEVETFELRHVVK